MNIKKLNPHNYALDPVTQANLQKLNDALIYLIVCKAPIETVTSGLRSQADQARINPKAMKSKHLTGEAADIADASGALADWVLAHEERLDEAGLWCEDVAYTKGWVHFQCVPPRSKKRFFIP